MPFDEREIDNTVRRALIKLRDNELKYARIDTESDKIFRLVENHPSPVLFFEITQIEDRNGKKIAHMRFKPAADYDAGETTKADNLTSVENHLKSWANRISYIKENPVFDDPIIQANYENLISFVNIPEHEDESKPLDLKSQLQLDKSLTNVITYLNAPEFENDLEANEIREQAIDLQKNQTKLTKGQVRKKFLVLLASAQKHGISLFKFIIQAIGKEVVVDGFEKLVDLIKLLGG